MLAMGNAAISFAGEHGRSHRNLIYFQLRSGGL